MGYVQRQYDKHVWGLKYRPPTVDNVILPKRFRNMFNKMLESKQIPNMLLSGPRGCGKTTVLFCLADQLDCESLYVNMSKDNSIDMVRTDLSRFATNIAMFDDMKKLIIGDEFDRLSIEAIDALKGDIETYGKNCSFVFTSNHKYKFIEHPVMSRLQEIDFEFSKEEKIQMQKDFFKAVCNILKKEKVKFEPKAIGYFIKTMFPDMRKTLNELQKIASQYENNITMEVIKESLSVTNLKLFFDSLKEKDFGYIREYIASLSMDMQSFYSVIFRNMEKYIKKESFADALYLIDEYSFHSAFASDKEIPLTTLCMKLMTNCEWK